MADKIVFFEHDLSRDHGVKLTVEKAADFRFEINVDGKILAAYIGTKDIKKLKDFIEENNAN